MKKTLALVLALCMVLGCIGAFAEGSEPTYTYNGSHPTIPTAWNVFTYQDSTAKDLALTWIRDGLYDFDYNENMDGFVWENHMAVGEPEDVTADYVGEDWGIAEGETGRAWKFTMRDDLKWNDGSVLNAKTVEESIKRLLDPVAKNFRADNIYASNPKVHNAEAYAKQGTTADTSIRSLMSLYGSEDLDSFLAEHGDLPAKVNWVYSFGAKYDFEAKSWGEGEDALVDSGKTLAEMVEFFKGEGQVYNGQSVETMIEYALDELSALYAYPEMSYDKVGVQAVSDNEFVVIVDTPVYGFYVKYQLDMTSWIVKPDLYDACATVTDGVFNSTYCTSKETTPSFGPYQIASYQTDKEIVHEKNPYWYGWNEPRFEGRYQATHVRYVPVTDTATRYEMFLSGQLDTFGLNKEYAEQYASSDYTYYSIGASTFGFAVNPSLEALTKTQEAAGENINKTILTLKEFRMALSLSLDRQGYCMAVNPIWIPAYALFSDSIVADPESGTPYRVTDAAKQTLVNFWGLADEVGEGKLYPTIDDAIENISGYNLEMGRQYFDMAYDKAIEQGLMDEDDKVQITIGLAADLPSYHDGYEFLSNNWIEAVKGTKLEGKLEFVKDNTISNAFGPALRNNNVDMLFNIGFQGGEFDAFGLFEVYCGSLRYDSSVDYTTINVDIELEGTTYTASVWDWFQIMNGSPAMATVTGSNDKVELCFPAGTDPEKNLERAVILAALENAVLQNYNYMPLIGDSAATLLSQKVNYFSDEYMFPMGFGGIPRMTFNYSDQEWADYVASQGGTLNYN